MSVFTSLIIILLAMVIQACLQLSPGIFTIFYHHALGKTSAKKTDDRSLSFILGIEICTAIIFLISYIIIGFFIKEQNFMNSTFLWIMSGIFLAEALFAIFLYFRPKRKSREKTTELFLSRAAAKSLIHHAEHLKNRSDTIAFGIVVCGLELFITLPLYIICSICIFNISINYGFVFIIAYIIVATLPLFIIRTLFHTGHNLAEIERTRVKRKNLIKIIIFLCFLSLAIITFITGLSK